MKAKVAYYGLHVGGEEDVGRLDVAVHVLLVVDVGKPPGEASRYLEPDFEG